jgi:hypothetical protein
MLVVILIIVVALVVGVCLASQPASSAPSSSYRARAAIRDIERHTVESMLMAEREARLADSFEGSVIEEGEA